MPTISDGPARGPTDSSGSVACSTVAEPVAILVDTDIGRIVERKLRSSNFRVLRWSLDSLGETNGFLGQYYTLSVSARIAGKSKRFKFFAKTPPPATSPQYDFLVRYNTFNKEIAVYSEIVPTMGVGRGPKWLPDYYLGKSNAVIVLEDAKEDGYVTPDKYLPFDEDHCVSVVRALSTFHSRSLILDEKLRRSTGETVLDLYRHMLEEVAFVEDDVQTGKYLSSCVMGACAVVDLAEGFEEAKATAIKEWIARWVPRLCGMLAPSSKFRNVICHRDVWPNNIMFKRDTEGKPIGCYLIDFQFLRYSPPALDFAVCLLLGTDRATRRRIHDQLVDVYHETMRRELAAEDLDVDECLTRAEFVESCEEVRRVSLAYSVANAQIMLLSRQAVEEYFIGSTDQLEHVMYGDKRPDLVRSQCRSVRMYRTRITEIIEEIGEHVASDRAAR